MKRLTFIYLAAPLNVGLNTLPGMLPGTWQMISAILLGLVLWSVVWLRVYANGKIRPEFAVLAVLPAVSYYIIQSAGDECITMFNAPGWQNFNFFLWLAAIFVNIRALLPTPAEYRGRLAADSVLIFMSIITTVYSLRCWATTHVNL